MDPPVTRYVSVGDAEVAFQVIGDGPIDLLFCYGLGNHIELLETLLGVGDLLTRLSSFSRLIWFDRRGTGASDNVPTTVPTWEEWTEDISAVLAAAGSERAAVLASLDVGPVAILYAAMHPEVVSALVLLNAGARYPWAADYPIGVSQEDLESLYEYLATGWGSEDFARMVNPSMADDIDYVRRAAKIMRTSATPRSAVAQYRLVHRALDVRPVLPLIQAPTLVLQSRDSGFLPQELGPYLAEHINGARFVELPVADLGLNPVSLYPVTDEVAQFLTGVRLDSEFERVLTTVLFSDIVGSTERVAAVGDHRWRATLDAHDKAVRDQLRIFRGREIKTTGDGFLASFDGPARAIRCAQAINDAMNPIGVELRMGLHTGECEVRGDDLAGLAVHIAARIGALATSREILVSSTLKDLVIGSPIEFTQRGTHDLKGVPGSWTVFAVVA
jgi:class 3 adenylate cyclase